MTTSGMLSGTIFGLAEQQTGLARIVDAVFLSGP
jgi:hypothetical protein